MSLVAPFPYFGGKRRLAQIIWEHLGDPVVYVETHAGSLACLLARPNGAGKREIVTDTDGGICNFWRAIEYGDIEEVAWWADYPTIHHDLTARHIWLRQWFNENAQRLIVDPNFFDPKVAGWWVWGISLWIGGGWCADTSDCIPKIYNSHGGSGVSAQRVSMPGERVSDKIPQVSSSIGGSGVSAQRVELQDKRPRVDRTSGGSGVAAQRINMPGEKTYDKRPHVASGSGGQGVSAQREELRDQRPHVKNSVGGQGVSVQRRTRTQLLDWFRDLQERLKGVIVLNRSWESAVTPTLLMHTPTSQKPSVGILMDPPYKTEERSNNLYASDLRGESSAIAVASYKWAVEHGNIYRIAYCAHEGDFEIPEGWRVVTSQLSGISKAERQRQEMVMFSPKCVAERQLNLL